MSIIDTLVTDRTYDDVRLLTEKGIYRAEDLNRVESAVKYIAGRLRERGYAVTTEDGPLWTEEDIPVLEQMSRYLDNLRAVRGAAPTLPGTPQVPPDMDMLTYREANDIEEILVNINRIMDNIEAAQMFSGEIYAGEIA